METFDGTCAIYADLSNRDSNRFSLETYTYTPAFRVCKNTRIRCRRGMPISIVSGVPLHSCGKIMAGTW